MRFLSWILYILLIILEGSVTTFPLVLIFLLCLMVMKRAEWVLLLALLSGIALDLLSLRPIGTSSVLLILFVFMIFLYERKYEIATIPFVFFSTLIGSFLYLTLLHYPSLIESIVSGIIGVLAFIAYQFIRRPKIPSHLDYQRV